MPSSSSKSSSAAAPHKVNTAADKSKLDQDWVFRHNGDSHIPIRNFKNKVDLQTIEAVPRLIQPCGKITLGPGSWGKLGTYVYIIEGRDELGPTPCGRACGDITFRRLRLVLERLKLRFAGEPNNNKLRAHMFREIRSYMDIPWHEWLFPIGPVTGDKKILAYVMQYAVCWGDVLYLVSCEGYLTRFIEGYTLLLELHALGCSLMVSTNEATMVLRWLHVIASVGIHIDVLENLDTKIGGNWSGAIHTLREIRNSMSTEFGINTGFINRITEQVSMKSVNNPNTGGQVCSSGTQKFQYSQLKDGWCKSA